MTGEPPAHLTDWRGDSVDPRSRPPGRAPERPLLRARRHSARRSPPSGRTRPACRSRRSSSVAAAPPPCRWCSSRTTGSHGVLVAATMGSEQTAAAAGEARRAAPRPVRDAALLRLQHGRLLGALADDDRAHRTRRRCPRSTASTGSARTRDGQVPVARLRRELPRARVDLPAARRRRRRRRDAHRRRADGRPISTSTVSTCRPTTSPRRLSSTPTTGAVELPDAPGVLRRARRPPPGRACARSCRRSKRRLRDA